jgi:hypothetical protein
MMRYRGVAHGPMSKIKDVYKKINGSAPIKTKKNIWFSGGLHFQKIKKPSANC